MIGGIEAGGTKFVCSVADDSLNILDTVVIPTTTPNEVMEQVVLFFKKYKITSLGVAAFGPICLDKEDVNYGMFTTTPKFSWRSFNIYNYLKTTLGVSVFINTDVALAAWGEYYYLKEKGINNIIYITVGTGIGAGVIHQGHIIQGKHHSEMGHFLINKKEDDHFQSLCPFHSTCLEGLASGLALQKRFSMTHEEMGKHDYVWDLEGYYLAQAIYDYTLTFAPDVIIFGGGVSHQEKLLGNVKKHFLKINNNYYSYPKDIDNYIINPTLKDNSGIIGALIYAKGDLNVR